MQSTVETFETWSAMLPGGMTPRSHLVDSVAYIIGELGSPADGTGLGLLDGFIRDNLGWEMSCEEFLRRFPWAHGALADALEEGAGCHALSQAVRLSNRMPADA